MAEDSQGGFKVTDRRLFNADGSLREDAQIEDPAPPAPTPAATFQQDAPESQPQFEPPAGFEDDLNAAHEQTMFTEFVMNVASSAFIYLGLVEHPATGRRQVEPMAAKESIDMLVMLREKTKGNLTHGEEKFFDELLSELKMQFVALRRQAGM